MRLVDQEGCEWSGRAHFLAVASRAMRQVLIDHARRRNTQKRGGDRLRITLDEGVEFRKESELDFDELERVLSELEELDPPLARVVELRFFAGMTIREAAEVLGVSPKTVERDWYAARAWLRRELARE